MGDYILILCRDSDTKKQGKALSSFAYSYLGNKSYKDINCYYYECDHRILASDKLEIRNALDPFDMDVLFVSSLLDLDKPALFAFDMDSTLIQEEVIDEIARENGVYEEVARVTEQAMQGNMSFDESLRKRCALLKGVSVDTYDKVYSRLTLNSGVGFFLENIKSFSAKVAVLSGGFHPILEKFQSNYGIHFFKGNVLEEENGVLTGRVLGEIINGDKKEFYLREIAEREGISLDQVVAVGDGSNDSLMINRAGIGIGFHAKDGLKRKIQNWVDHFGMEVLFFLFYPEFLNR